MAFLVKFYYFLFKLFICLNILVAGENEDVQHITAITTEHKVEVSHAIITTSNFITEFHKKFQNDSFRQSQPYLLSLADDVIDNIVRNPFSSPSVINVSNLHNHKNRSERNIISTSKNGGIHNHHVVNCAPYDYIGSPKVEIVNDTQVFEILMPLIQANRSTPCTCVILLFYAHSCPFSAMAAPHFNSLPRAFPSLRIVALDSYKYQSLNVLYGIIAVPTVILFHNGRPVSKFNYSEYTLAEFTKFITKCTGIRGNDKMYVTSYDFGGPLKSVPSNDTDYMLILSWVIIILFVLVKVCSHIV